MKNVVLRAFLLLQCTTAGFLHASECVEETESRREVEHALEVLRTSGEVGIKILLGELVRCGGLQNFPPLSNRPSAATILPTTSGVIPAQSCTFEDVYVSGELAGPGGGYIKNNGNSFGVPISIGSNDAQSVSLRVQGVNALTFATNRTGTINAPVAGTTTPTLTIIGPDTDPGVPLRVQSSWGGGCIEADYGWIESPAYGFIGHKTGMYSPADNFLGLVTNGLDRFSIAPEGTCQVNPSLSATAASLRIIGANANIPLRVDASGNNSSIWVASGATATPAYAFTSSQTTGMYLKTGTSVALSTLGNDMIVIGANGTSIPAPTSGSALSVTGNALAPAVAVTAGAGQNAVVTNLGSATEPSYSFTGDSNTGLYSPGADQITAVTNGSEKLRITSLAALCVNPYVLAVTFVTGSGPVLPAGNSDVIFNQVVIDPASSYNTATGIFTAPITGKYLVSAVVGGTSSSANPGMHSIMINLNGIDQGAATFWPNPTNPNPQFNVVTGINMMLLSLNQGDLVKIVLFVDNGAFSVNNFYTRFIVQLVGI